MTAVRDVARGTWPDLATLPRAPVRLVPRDSQVRRLERLAPVTVIEALAGFGKTTLGVAWAHKLQDEGSRVIWIQARQDLDDQSRFMEFLQQRLDLSGAHTSPDPDSLLMVIVDDAEQLRNHVTWDAMVRLVKGTDRMHLTALTCPGHPIAAAAARHDLETNVLGGRDLEITSDDVTTFAVAWGHGLSRDSAELLHSTVGGWLLPLRLVLDATPTGSAGFATHAAHDFLMARVLPDISDLGELSRAQQLAVPRAFDLGLAAAILGADSAQVRGHLAALERKGLLCRFSSNDGTVRWRFPTLLRRVLLDRLERTQPRDARAAHLLTASALAASHETHDASEMLLHARSGGDWALLTRLWTDRGWSLLAREPVAFQGAYAAIPPVVAQENPTLALPASLGDALARTSGEVDPMRRLESLLGQYTETGADLLRRREASGGPGMVAEMLTATMIAQRTEGALTAARELAVAAGTELERARLVEPDRPQRSQVAWFHLQNAVTQLHSARFPEALREAASAHRVEPSGIVGASAAALLAAVHTTNGLTTLGGEWLAAHESFDLSGHWVAGLAGLPARMTRAMFALDRLDKETSEVELKHLRGGLETSGLWQLILLVQVRHALLFGDPVAQLAQVDHARRVLARHLPNDGSMADQVVDRCQADLMLALGEVNRVQSLLRETGRPWLVAPTARFHLITGRHDAAAKIAAAGMWRQDVAVRDRLELLVISSIALSEQGESDRALQAFRRAHALYLDVRTLQPLLLMSPDVRHDLMEAAGLGFPAEVIARLDAVGPIYPERAELVSLSPRELEVLARMRRHDSMASLARSLNVSVNTVKKQLVSLYAKLGVKDRASALLRASALGIIDNVSDTPNR